jgi:hypothetical protein
MLKIIVAGMIAVSLLGASPAFAFWVGKVARAVGAAKTGTTVADKTSEDEVNKNIDANLAYLRESHRLDRTDQPEKIRS